MHHPSPPHPTPPLPGERDRQTQREGGGREETDRQTDRRTDRQTGRQTNKDRERESEIRRKRKRGRDRQTDRQTDRLRDGETDRQRQTGTNRQTETDRQTDRQGRTDGQTENGQREGRGSVQKSACGISQTVDLTLFRPLGEIQKPGQCRSFERTNKQQQQSPQGFSHTTQLHQHPLVSTPGLNRVSLNPLF